MKLHLVVLGIRNSEIRAVNTALYSERTHDFSWNDDFTAFRPIKLKWWDEASYISYQTDLHGEK